MPLYMVEGYEKPAILHITSDWDITGYTWEVTGMFEDMNGDSMDHWFQPRACEVRVHCPFDWFSNAVPVTPGTVILTATVTDELGQTATTDPVAIQVMPARASISGRLLKTDGNPATGGEVFLTLNVDGKWGAIYYPDTFYTVTAADGTFSFDDILKLDEFQLEDMDFDENWNPTALTVNSAILNELTVHAAFLDANFHGNAGHSETTLPTGDLVLGDISLAETTAPVVVVNRPLDGSAVITGETLSLDAYIRAEVNPLSVTARTEWSGTDTVLTDAGEATDFRWGGRNGYHHLTGSVPVPDSPEVGAWFTPLKLTITATDGAGKSTVDTRTLQAFTLGSGDTLPVPEVHAVFPGISQSAPVDMPGMILPIQILDETGNPPAFFRFAAAKYDEADLYSGMGGGKNKTTRQRGKGIMSDGTNGYGELQNPDQFAATQRLRVAIQTGSDLWDSLYLNLDVPILDGFEAHPAADLAGDLSGWADTDVLLTSGTLLIDGNATFRNLIVATGATIEMSGSAALTVTGRLVLMPGATLSNINPGGTPKVSVSGTDLFLYGDYTGKGQPDPPITFTATGGIHEQNN